MAIDNSKYDQVVWRPDFYGSVLFLVASLFGILALGRLWSWRPREAAWWVAWLNMVGSIAFMASAIGAFVIPRTASAVDLTLADRGTLVGAVCFFLGALLMFPAFRQAGAAAKVRAEERAQQRTQIIRLNHTETRFSMTIARMLYPAQDPLGAGVLNARSRSAVAASGSPRTACRMCTRRSSVASTWSARNSP